MTKIFEQIMSFAIYQATINVQKLMSPAIVKEEMIVFSVI